MSVSILYAVCLAAGLPEGELEHRFHPTRKWKWDLAGVNL